MRPSCKLSRGVIENKKEYILSYNADCNNINFKNTPSIQQLTLIPKTICHIELIDISPPCKNQIVQPLQTHVSSSSVENQDIS